MACRVGFFNPSAGARDGTACMRCPEHSTTAGPASASARACVCERGFFYDARAAACKSCFIGTACHSIGTTVASLPVLAGYYRLSNASLDVRRCPDAAANCTDAPSCPESTSGCRGTVFAAQAPAACHANLTGVFCRLCATRPGGVRVYYSSATSRQRADCKECRSLVKDAVLLALGAVSAVVVAALAALCIYRRCLSSHHRAQLEQAWRTFTPHVKLKILIGFYLIASKVDDVYAVEMPPQVQRILNAVAISVSVGFNGVGTVLDCLSMRGYVPTLAVHMVAPALLACLVLLAGVARLQRYVPRADRTAMALFERTAPLLLKLIFLFYPLVTNVAFEAFSCYAFLESQWLKADVSIRCGSDAHRRAQALAWAAIAIYPVGLLALTAVLLFVVRHAVYHERPTRLSRSLDFLHREYEPHLFWCAPSLAIPTVTPIRSHPSGVPQPRDPHTPIRSHPSGVPQPRDPHTPIRSHPSGVPQPRDPHSHAHQISPFWCAPASRSPQSRPSHLTLAIPTRSHALCCVLHDRGRAEGREWEVHGAQTPSHHPIDGHLVPKYLRIVDRSGGSWWSWCVALFS